MNALIQIAGEGLPIDSVLHLNANEYRIFQMFGDGKTNSEVAEQTKYSVRTIEAYVEELKHKLNFSDSTKMRVFAAKFNQIAETQKLKRVPADLEPRAEFKFESAG